MSLSRAESLAVVGDLRRTRRKQRVAAIHWIDAMYQVYITGVIALVVLLALSSAIGDEKVGAATLLDVERLGPALVGTVVAFAIFGGLRAGSRGGPLALERPDVRHVLLAPIDRGVALRGPAWRQLRFLSTTGAAVGACAGQLALRRLPGNGLGWVLFGALFGLVVVWLWFGSALVASGLRVKSWLATLLGGALVIWSIADLLDRAPTAPATFVGRLPLWMLDAAPESLAGVVLAVALVAVGMALVSGTSIEAAERRASLVGQLRFAVTLQDLRTVLVLRKQLAQERPRPRPWIRPIRRGRARFPVFQRGVRSVLRWPASRLVRVFVLVAIAGLTMRGAWGGTTPLVLVAGLALWIAALDAAEPLGQEVDHPGRTDAFPIERGTLFLAHLPLVALVSILTGLLAGAVAAVPLGAPVPWSVALLAGAAAGLLAGCGAAVSVVQGAPEPVDTMTIATPEIAGMRTVMRTAFPPGLAVLGVLPLLAARAAERGAGDPPPLAAATTVIVPLIAVAVIVGGWVRFRDVVASFMKEAADSMSPTKAAERASEARAAEREREAEALAESRRIGGIADDADDASDDATNTSAAKPRRSSAPRPAPKPKPKPKPSDAVPGVQGGTSAKPIGRKRDQAT